jgi:hypothetical protein
MEDQDDVFPDVEQQIRDQIDDEIVNHELMERAPEQRDDRNHRDVKSGSRRP